MDTPGYADIQGTEHFKERFNDKVSEKHFKMAQGLWWSSLGMGTYLGAADEATDDLIQSAVKSCIASGVNVIDTAINYRRERSERAVGHALQELFAERKLSRNEILVCTKGGFVPQSLGPDWFRSKFGPGSYNPLDRTEFVAECHCMHPDYLADQLDRSRTNLGLETIDLYYLHNPETQLGKVDEDVFFERLFSAFACLEEAVSQGKIRYYGLATWTAFRVEEAHPQYISLEKVKGLAKSAAQGEDHFKFIQLPLNLAMKEAVKNENQLHNNRMKSMLDAADGLGIKILASGSICQGRLAPADEQWNTRFNPSFSSFKQLALHWTRSAPRLLSALVGMKSPGHVQENLALCQRPLFPPERFAKYL